MFENDRVAITSSLGKSVNMKMISNIAIVICSLLIAYSAQAKTSVVIVQGLAGENYYQRHFDEQVEKILSASSNLVTEDEVIVFGNTDYAVANKENVMPQLQKVFSDAGSDDLVLLYLIGHGSFDGRDYKFNIDGEDITGTDMIELFNEDDSVESSGASVVLINTSSSSGALLKPFAETNIHLVSATKSGAERTATRFGRHFADGLVVDEADINKNKSISLQEAYNYAVRETQAFYDEEGLLATESPRLQMIEGKTAADQIRLANLVAKSTVPVSNELAAMYERRDELDREIDTLRLRRINLSDEEYLQQFQNLMVRLSLLQANIDSESDAVPNETDIEEGE